MSATLHAKIFLQALLSQPALPLAQALALYSTTAQAAHTYDSDLPAPPTKAQREDRWNEFRHDLNEQLGVLGMEIRQVVDEGDRGWWVVLVNTEVDDLALSATVYSPLELSYLKALVRAIVLAPNYAFSLNRLNASRLAQNLPGHTSSALSRAAAEALVDRFVAGGWLEVSKARKRLSLTIRTACELEGYLEKEFPPGFDDDEDDDDGRPRILKCSLCKGIVTKGKLCPSCPAEHPTAIHHHCLHKMLLRASASASRRLGKSGNAPPPVAIHCSAEGEGVVWSAEAVRVDGEDSAWLPVGEDAVGRDDDDKGYMPKGRQSSGAAPAPKKRGPAKGLEGKGKKRVASDDEDDLQSEEESEAESSEAEEAGAPVPVQHRETRSRTRASPVQSASPAKKAPKKGGKKKFRASTPPSEDDNSNSDNSDDP